MWTGREQWLDAVEALLATPEGEALRKRHKVKADTFIDVMRVWAGAADTTTGRNMALAHQTVARRLGCSPRHVARAAALAEALGVAVTIRPGSYLDRSARAQAHETTGNSQITVASIRALTAPKPQSTTPNVNPPSWGIDPGPSSVVRRLPGRPARSRRPGRRAAARPATTNQWRAGPEALDLAAQLARRVPWLRPFRPHRIARALANAGLDPTGWTSSDLIDALDRRNRDHGWFSIVPKRPLGWLVTATREATIGVEPPAARRAREKSEYGRAAEAERLARAADHERAAAERAAAEKAKETLRALWLGDHRPRPPREPKVMPFVTSEHQAALMGHVQEIVARQKAAALARRQTPPADRTDQNDRWTTPR
ncbi:MAG: hypothetical protein LBJ44_07295 [Propionibacteriaceae bacterium]|jgi:hypothetical protein|nr:hypothetical protein [Propionibacteriaceae bacterium]